MKSFEGHNTIESDMVPVLLPYNWHFFPTVRPILLSGFSPRNPVDCRRLESVQLDENSLMYAPFSFSPRSIPTSSSGLTAGASALHPSVCSNDLNYLPKSSSFSGKVPSYQVGLRIITILPHLPTFWSPTAEAFCNKTTFGAVLSRLYRSPLG